MVIDIETAVERDGNWSHKYDYKMKGDMYIPRGSHDTKLRTEAMLTKLIKGQESQDASIKEIKADFSGLNQKVESHVTTTKQLEHQFKQISSTLNNRQSGTLPSDMV